MTRRVRAVVVLVAVLGLGIACGGFGGEDAALEELPPESPFTWGLLMSWAALTIGGGSAVLGIWVDRDRSRPALFALAMSCLISTAMCVGALQGYLDEEQAIETRANLDRMLTMVDDIAATSGDPALAALVEEKSGHRRSGGAARRQRPVDLPIAPTDEAEPTDAAPTDAAPTDAAPTEDGTAPTDGAPADEATPAAEDVPADGTDPGATDADAGRNSKAAKARTGGQ